jgi:hypothetical protein
MKEVEKEHLDHDTDEIEHCVEADDNDAIVSDEPNMVPSALPGEPNNQMVGPHLPLLPTIGIPPLIH